MLHERIVDGGVGNNAKKVSFSAEQRMAPSGLDKGIASRKHEVDDDDDDGKANYVCTGPKAHYLDESASLCILLPSIMSI